MTQSALTFDDNKGEWLADHQAVRFAGKIDGEQVPFEIDQGGLTACAGINLTDLDREQLLAIYADHIRDIQAMAVREHERRDRSERPILLSANDFVNI